MRALIALLSLTLAATAFGQNGGDSAGVGGASSNGGAGGQSSGSESSSAQGGGSQSFGVAVSANYVLKPSDVIKVQVFQEEDLTKEVRVEADGTVTLPLIGSVKIGGMTVGEAQSLVTELYNRDYLVNPQVSLLVLQFSPKYVQVLGRTTEQRPVEIPSDRELTLTDAISRVGGITRLGNPKQVKIKRVTDDGDTKTMTVNFDRIVTDPDESDIVLQPGDTIYVPERRI